MDLDLLSWVPAAWDNDLLVGAIFFAATTLLIALWVPGILLPMAASLGALLGPWAAGAVVSLGALLGSMIIFVTTRHFAQGRIHVRAAAFLTRFEAGAKSRGAWFVLGLRLIGTPHFLVSSGSALTRIHPLAFALATLVGLLPAIALAAIAGSSIA